MKQLTFLVSVLVCCISVTAQTAGPRTPASFTTDNSIGSFSWSNSSNIQSSDNSRAVAGVFLGALSTVTSNYVLAQNFGFSIPSTAVITGIVVTVEKQASGIGVGSSINDNAVQLIKNGTITSTNKATSTDWGTTDVTENYGTLSDSWGSTWTPADINASNFGVAFSAKLSSGLVGLTLTALVDQITVTVYYNVVVPVSFKQVSAITQAQKVKVTWSTATEFNCSYFNLQKKDQQTNSWLNIDSIPVKASNPYGNEYFSFDHNTQAYNLYRVKETDTDGKEYYSETVSAKVQTPVTVNTYPNPVTNELRVSSTEVITGVIVINNKGKQLAEITPVTNVARINFSHIPEGLYYVVVKSKNSISRHKIICKH